MPIVRKKILHVITSLTDGGAEALLYRICINSKNLGIQHYIVSLKEMGKYGDLFKQNGFSVECLHISNLLDLIVAAPVLCKIITKIKPDTVQTWLYHSDLLGGVCAKFVGINSINWSIHNTVFEYKNTSFLNYLLVKLLVILSYFIPTKIVCCSESAKNSHQKLGYCKSKMLVIWNGYDTNIFKPDANHRCAERSKYKIRESIFLVGMVARNSIPKDYNTLIKALKILKEKQYEIQCVMVGHSVSDLQTEINQDGLKGTVILQESRSDIEYLYNALDVFILSSSAEACPNVIAEAMSCGIPCIATNVGDCKYLIGNTGTLVRPKSPVDLSVAIEKMYEEKKSSTWSLKKENCRYRIRNYFSFEPMLKKYLTLWGIELS